MTVFSAWTEINHFQEDTRLSLGMVVVTIGENTE